MEGQPSTPKECPQPLNWLAAPTPIVCPPGMLCQLLKVVITLKLCYGCLIHAQCVLGHNPQWPGIQISFGKFAQMDQWPHSSPSHPAPAHPTRFHPGLCPSGPGCTLAALSKPLTSHSPPPNQAGCPLLKGNLGIYGGVFLIFKGVAVIPNPGCEGPVSMGFMAAAGNL